MIARSPVSSLNVPTRKSLSLWSDPLLEELRPPFPKQMIKRCCSHGNPETRFYEVARRRCSPPPVVFQAFSAH